MSGCLVIIQMCDDFTHEEIISAAKRLRKARINAGFVTPAAAFLRFGWDSMTYLQHEDGIRMFDAETAFKYGNAFNVSRDWLLLGKK